MSILDESGRAAEAVEADPTADWDDLRRQLHLHAWTQRPVVRCHWVRDPLGDGMISVWAPATPTTGETL